MSTGIYWIIGIVLALVISLLFEDVRDFLSDIFQTIWESLTDGFSYFISFEWVMDALEFIGGMFENLEEFSVAGLVSGAFAIGIIWMLSDYLIKPFMEYSDPVQKVIWTALTYIVCGMGGYLTGKKLLDD